MVGSWVVKAAYSLGGHILTDKDGKTIRYNTEAAANDSAVMLNMNRSDMSVYYIVVKEP